MEYRSYADLADAVVRNAYRVPSDIDLVVGIPRSGILPASMLALQLNLPFQELEAFLQRCPIMVGRTAKVTISTEAPIRKVLVVDDSVASGESARDVRSRLEAERPDLETVFLAVYGTTGHSADVEIIFEVVETPRMFQWNLMRHARLGDACFDIDGVLCHDPDQRENDDAEGYLKFLLEAKPLLRSNARIKHLVTSRLEKYRPQTEQWLREHGVDYEKLWMLDLPSAEERRRQGAHGSFKARIYRETGAGIFVESEGRQAQEIANLSNKPVLSIEDQAIIWPEGSGKNAQRQYRIRQRMKTEAPARVLARSVAHALLGSSNIAKIRRKFSR
jgi:uncharacterized HAD superfamily protein/hypoxanthine phosphoribosyltransferase